jgi:hypothetical protein
MPSTTGELVTERFDYDGGRRVSAYVPAEPPETVVFAGDGQLLPAWGADLEALDLPPTLIIGTHRPADETLRLHEYSPTFDPQGSRPTNSSSSRTFASGRRRASG